MRRESGKVLQDPAGYYIQFGFFPDEDEEPLEGILRQM